MKQWDKIYRQYGRSYTTLQKDLPQIVGVFKEHGKTKKGKKRCSIKLQACIKIILGERTN